MGGASPLYLSTCGRYFIHFLSSSDKNSNKVHLVYNPLLLLLYLPLTYSH